MNLRRLSLLSCPSLCLLLFSLTACGGGGGNSSGGTTGSAEPTVIEVMDTVQLTAPKRLGINIGSYSPFSDAGMLKNVITNAGFEAGEIAMIFLAEEGTQASQVQADNWQTRWNRDDLNIGQPVGFWNNASYEVLSGTAKGRTGTVTDFTHDDGLYTFSLSGSSPLISTTDAVIVRQQLSGYEGDSNSLAVADTTENRPNSAGKQSLALLPASADWQASFNYYLDSFWRDTDSSAGKLMPVEGRWRVAVWAKAEQASNTLNVRLRREGETTFFSETIPLTQDWQLIEREFTVAAGTDVANTSDSARNILSFQLKIPTGNGKVWVDDLVLERLDQSNPTIFSDAFVERLQDLNPAVIRDWGGQLGASLDTQLAEPFARGTTAYSPRQRIASRYHYSLPEFLQLAQYLGAEPWYVVPPTFTAEELQNLIAFLAAPVGAHPYANKRAELGQVTPWTQVFSQIHLEYGNEMWGGNDASDPFTGASLRGGKRLGEVANDRFALMKASPYFNSAKLDLIIGGQSRVPDRQGEIEQASSQHNTIAVAPYFGVLDSYATEEEQFYPLFARAVADVNTGGRVRLSQDKLDAAGQGTGLAVYEINFHTTDGDAPLDVRNDFVTSLGSGLALPLYMLNYQKFMGITTQAAYQMLQYSNQMDDGDSVRLWGLLRDLEATSRKRPTWLGIELANRAIHGEMLATQHSGSNPVWTQAAINDLDNPVDLPFLHSFAFREGTQYYLMLFNLHLYEAQTVTLQLPTEVSATATLHAMTSASVRDDNEDAQVISLQTQTLTQFNRNYTLSLNPHSAYVLAWDAN